jgi:hypothetical protein
LPFISCDSGEIPCGAIDLERSSFIRLHFKRDIGDPRFYDLIFSTDSLVPQQAVAISLAAM